MSALVLHGHLKSSLACVRSLRTARVPIVVGSEYQLAMAGFSRGVTRRFTYPSPKVDQVGYVASVKAEATALHEATGERPVIYAPSDETLLPLLLARAELESVCRLPEITPDQQAIVFDKEATRAWAETHGVTTIRTITADSLAELLKQMRGMAYPAVIKPRDSYVWHQGRGVTRTAHYVFSDQEAQAVAEELYQAMGVVPLVQPYLEGGEYGVEGVYEKGKPLAQLVHRRVRSLSPRGGAATTKETVAGPVADRLQALAEKIVSHLEWSGPMMVECKYNEVTHTAYLMELNGRWWGSLPLSAHAGLSLPLCYYYLQRDEAREIITAHARRGIRSQHVMGDLVHLSRVLFADDPARELCYPKRTSALGAVLADLFGARKDVWSLRDPLPCILELCWILLRR